MRADSISKHGSLVYVTLEVARSSCFCDERENSARPSLVFFSTSVRSQLILSVGIPLLLIRLAPGNRYNHSSLLRPRQSELIHLDSELENVVDALALRLCFVYIVTPDVSNFVSMLINLTGCKSDSHSMSPNQNRVRVGVFFHSCLKTLSEILFVCCVLDNRDS